MSQRYDVIVVGTGGVGSAVLWQLSRRGVSVVGIDPRPPAHAWGSSHGETRAIRQAYFEHPDYVPLVQQAFRWWRRLEQEQAAREEPDPLLHLTGLLQFGPPRGNVISGILASAERHGLAIERLAPDETTRRFPAFRVPDDAACVFESEAGFLRVEHCVRAFLRQAQASGGQTLSATCHSWRETPRGVVVETSEGRVEADQLVMTAGPWSPALLEDAVPRIVVLAKHLHWFPCPNENFRPDAGMPVFLAERPAGVFYGFPQWEGRCKLAEHSGGTPVDVDLDHVRRDVDPDDLRRVQAFGRDCLVDLPMESPVDHTVCFYSLSNDGHFYLGTLPGRTRVHVAAGLSGHGFKFAPVLGQALAELALDGKTDLPIGFLNPGRASDDRP